MNEADLIATAIAGLDFEYMAYASILQERNSLTWPEMYASLLSFEARLQQIHSVTVNLGNMSVTPSANIAFVKTQNPQHNGRSQKHNGKSNSQGRGNGHRGSDTGNRGHRGRGRGRYNGGTRPVCQI
ncbi:hypothetical protein Scep_017026 [Stephania cephalantha]|uniref:Uncharacterized protein n=1 Tax=Stephania cephalantha TaxID=152367 RepID=A0AAP0INS6_9MAGN